MKQVKIMMLAAIVSFCATLKHRLIYPKSYMKNLFLR